MSKYITKEDFIKKIEVQKEWWELSARESAKFIAETVTRVHPDSSTMEIGLSNCEDYGKTQLERVKKNLANMLPYLDFEFTPIERISDATKYLVRWKLKEEENLWQALKP